MFTPRENPGYNKLAQDATEVIHGWLQNGWYETSAEEPLLLEEAPLTEDVLSPETPEVEKTV
jgi:hypothetical protein